MSEREGKAPVTRRAFLSRIIQAIGGLVAAAVAIPGLGYILSPLLAREESSWREVGPITDFRLGQTVLTIFAATQRDGWVEAVHHVPIYVRRTTENAFTVFSPKCTHLGCLIQWSEPAREFFCPCHAGVFDENGVNIAGPPPRPLDRYTTKIENGLLYVGIQTPSTK